MRPRSKANFGITAAGGGQSAAPAWGTGTKWVSGNHTAAATALGGRVTPGGTVYQRPRSQVTLRLSLAAVSTCLCGVLC